MQDPTPKYYYMVKNLTDAGSCVTVSSGTLDGDTYTAMKVAVDAANPVPTGEAVCLYDQVEDFRAALGLPVFTGGETSDLMLQKELEFCELISNKFRVANNGLSIVAGEVLFGELEPASHAISRGLVNIAWSRFNATNDAVVTPVMKAQFNALFDDFFEKFPRDRS